MKRYIFLLLMLVSCKPPIEIPDASLKEFAVYETLLTPTSLCKITPKLIGNMPEADIFNQIEIKNLDKNITITSNKGGKETKIPIAEFYPDGQIKQSDLFNKINLLKTNKGETVLIYPSEKKVGFSIVYLNSEDNSQKEFKVQPINEEWINLIGYDIVANGDNTLTWLFVTKDPTTGVLLFHPCHPEASISCEVVHYSVKAALIKTDIEGKAINSESSIITDASDRTSVKLLSTKIGNIIYFNQQFYLIKQPEANNEKAEDNKNSNNTDQLSGLIESFNKESIFSPVVTNKGIAYLTIKKEGVFLIHKDFRGNPVQDPVQIEGNEFILNITDSEDINRWANNNLPLLRWTGDRFLLWDKFRKTISRIVVYPLKQQNKNSKNILLDEKNKQPLNYLGGEFYIPWTYEIDPSFNSDIDTYYSRHFGLIQKLSPDFLGYTNMSLSGVAIDFPWYHKAEGIIKDLKISFDEKQYVIAWSVETQKNKKNLEVWAGRFVCPDPAQ